MKTAKTTDFGDIAAMAVDGTLRDVGKKDFET